MTIVYYLMTHRGSGQILRLVERLRRSDNSFVLVHHDANRPPISLPKDERIAVVPDPVGVEWGKISVVLAMWKAIEWLRATGMPFDWLIYLSGQDYPVKPAITVENELASRPHIHAYVHHELISEKPISGERYYRSLCRRRYFCRRVKVPAMVPLYIKRRHPFRSRFQCFAGSQWVNLSHAAVDSLWQRRSVAKELIAYHARSSVPDETVFHTLLANDPTLQLENNDKRFILWKDDADSPEILTSRHLEAIRSSGDWFARKVDETISRDLLAQLDRLMLS